MAIRGVIQIGDLNDALRDIIKDYAGNATEIIEDAAEKSAKYAVKLLRKDSPKNTGAYRKGWRLKRQNNRRLGTSFIVHNATDYQLTHLLENEHATADGTGRVEPRVHIKPVEDVAVKMFVDLVEEGVKNGR